MDQTTMTPATVREAAEMAEKQGMKLSTFLATLTIPTPPAGYILAEGCSEVWIGHEIVSRGWIITPAWNATTDTHSLEVWMANHEAPTYANLSPSDALQLAADLITAAQAINSQA